MAWHRGEEEALNYIDDELAKISMRLDCFPAAGLVTEPMRQARPQEAVSPKAY